MPREMIVQSSCKSCDGYRTKIKSYLREFRKVISVTVFQKKPPLTAGIKLPDPWLIEFVRAAEVVYWG